MRGCLDRTQQPEEHVRRLVCRFADMSSLAPDVEHTFELALPQLRPGQFQGLIFDTVESETTRKVRPHGGLQSQWQVQPSSLPTKIP